LIYQATALVTFYELPWRGQIKVGYGLFFRVLKDFKRFEKCPQV